jgi:hypothetical protein
MQIGDLGWYHVIGGWLPCKVTSACRTYRGIRLFHGGKPLRVRVVSVYNLRRWNDRPSSNIMNEQDVDKAFSAGLLR